MDFVVGTQEQRNKLKQIVEEVRATVFLPPAVPQAGEADHMQAALPQAQKHELWN